MTTKIITEDCPADCECYDTEPLVEVLPRVYTNTNGGSGPSDHLKEMLLRKANNIKDLAKKRKKSEKKTI